MITPMENIRVNIIGFVKKGAKDEAGVKVEKSDILQRYSIDKSGNIFRIEFYKNDKFTGMILINFDKQFDYENLSKMMTNSTKKELSL
jgi:hypothetical protein